MQFQRFAVENKGKIAIEIKLIQSSGYTLVLC